MLSTGGSPDTTIPAPLWTPTSTNLFDAQNGPMANLGVSMVQRLQAYVQSGGKTSQLAAKFPLVEFQNGMVGLQLKSLGGDFNQFQSASSRTSGCRSRRRAPITGWSMVIAPINELPTHRQLPRRRAGRRMY